VHVTVQFVWYAAIRQRPKPVTSIAPAYPPPRAPGCFGASPPQGISVGSKRNSTTLPLQRLTSTSYVTCIPNDWIDRRRYVRRSLITVLYRACGLRRHIRSPREQESSLLGQNLCRKNSILATIIFLPSLHRPTLSVSHSINRQWLRMGLRSWEVCPVWCYPGDGTFFWNFSRNFRLHAHCVFVRAHRRQRRLPISSLCVYGHAHVCACGVSVECAGCVRPSCTR
jgi:hypothetical protein